MEIENRKRFVGVLADIGFRFRNPRYLYYMNDRREQATRLMGRQSQVSYKVIDSSGFIRLLLPVVLWPVLPEKSKDVIF